MMKQIVLLVVFISVSSWLMEATNAGTANVETLLSAFKSKNMDRVLSSLNEIKRSRYQGDVLPLLEALWNKDEQAASRVPREMLDYDIVRIHIADVLMQARNNGLIDIPVSNIHASARRLLKSPDKEVVAATVFVLAQVDDPRDVEELENIALSNEGYLFRSSVIALSMMCNPAAGPALKKIGDLVRSPEKAQFVRETRGKLSNFKYCLRTKPKNRRGM